MLTKGDKRKILELERIIETLKKQISALETERAELNTGTKQLLALDTLREAQRLSEIADAMNTAVQAEREACAKLLEDHGQSSSRLDAAVFEYGANSIRQRGSMKVDNFEKRHALFIIPATEGFRRVGCVCGWMSPVAHLVKNGPPNLWFEDEVNREFKLHCDTQRIIEKRKLEQNESR